MGSLTGEDLGKAATVARVVGGDVDNPLFGAAALWWWLSSSGGVGACPVETGERFDAEAWAMVGWGAPIVAAARVPGARLRSDLTSGWQELADLDVALFQAVIGLASAAVAEALSTIGRRVLSVVKDPAVRAAMRDYPLHEVVAFARASDAVSAAMSERDRVDVDREVRKFRRNAHREISGTVTAAAAVLAGLVGASRAAGWEKAARGRVDEGVDELADLVDQTITARADTTDDDRLVPVWVTASAVWAALTKVGGSPDRQVVGVGSGAAALDVVTGAVTDATVALGGAVTRLDADRVLSGVGLGSSAVGDVARGVAVGRVTVGLLRVWQHVTGAGAFDPHKRLDGRTDRDDPEVFANYGRFPSGPQFAPGDHIGCRCRWQHQLTVEVV